MRYVTVFSFLLLYAAQQAHAGNPTLEAAEKYVKGVKWRQESVVVGNFSCRGKKERALLGTSKEHLVVAIFIRGLNKPPEVLRYSAAARNPATAVLAIEDMDIDPKEFEEEVGYVPPGMRRSKSCKGLNLSDGEVDSAHIYWDHNAKRFSDWVL